MTFPKRSIQEINIQLLDEGVETWRPTQAVDLGNGLFKVLPLADGNFKDEKWEFPPGAIVRVVEKSLVRGIEPINVLVAVKP